MADAPFAPPFVGCHLSKEQWLGVPSIARVALVEGCAVKYTEGLLNERRETTTVALGQLDAPAQLAVFARISAATGPIKSSIVDAAGDNVLGQQGKWRGEALPATAHPFPSVAAFETTLSALRSAGVCARLKRQDGAMRVVYDICTVRPAAPAGAAADALPPAACGACLAASHPEFTPGIHDPLRVRQPTEAQLTDAVPAQGAGRTKFAKTYAIVASDAGEAAYFKRAPMAVAPAAAGVKRKHAAAADSDDSNSDSDSDGEGGGMEAVAAHVKKKREAAAVRKLLEAPTVVQDHPRVVRDPHAEGKFAGGSMSAVGVVAQLRSKASLSLDKAQGSDHILLATYLVSGTPGTTTTYGNVRELGSDWDGDIGPMLDSLDAITGLEQIPILKRAILPAMQPFAPQYVGAAFAGDKLAGRTDGGWNVAFKTGKTGDEGWNKMPDGLPVEMMGWDKFSSFVGTSPDKSEFFSRVLVPLTVEASGHQLSVDFLRVPPPVGRHHGALAGDVGHPPLPVDPAAGRGRGHRAGGLAHAQAPAQRARLPPALGKERPVAGRDHGVVVLGFPRPGKARRHVNAVRRGVIV